MSRKITRQSRAQVIALAAQDEGRLVGQFNRLLLYTVTLLLVSWLSMILSSHYL